MKDKRAKSSSNKNQKTLPLQTSSESLKIIENYHVRKNMNKYENNQQFLKKHGPVNFSNSIFTRTTLANRGGGRKIQIVKPVLRPLTWRKNSTSSKSQYGKSINFSNTDRLSSINQSIKKKEERKKSIGTFGITIEDGALNEDSQLITERRND